MPLCSSACARALSLGPFIITSGFVFYRLLFHSLFSLFSLHLSFLSSFFCPPESFQFSCSFSVLLSASLYVLLLTSCRPCCSILFNFSIFPFLAVTSFFSFYLPSFPLNLRRLPPARLSLGVYSRPTALCIFRSVCPSPISYLTHFGLTVLFAFILGVPPFRFLRLD